LVPSLNGSEVLYNWPSLYSPTAKEEAELTKLRADTAVQLIAAGVLTAEEVRTIAGEMLAIDLETQPDVNIMEEPPEVEEEELKGDALYHIRSRFVDQASRLADKRQPNLYSSLKPIVERELKGLPALEVQGLTVYIADQWELIGDDLDEFMATRDPDNYDEAEVRQMMRTRAGLRADQIIRMVRQAYDRADIGAEGERFFEWRTVGDDRVRPEHVALDGRIYPLGEGHPEEGFPGDAHGCRCMAVPVTSTEVIQGDAESFTPPAGVQRAAQRALRVRRQSVPSQRGMTAVGLARARDLANGRPVSEETVRRMLNYFTRHEVDKEGSTWDEQGKGWQAWHGWGGDAGFRWARRIVNQLDANKGDAKKTGAATPAEPEERITGSRRNPEGSASGTRGGIKISQETEAALKRKVEEHNEEHGDDPAKRADLGMLKAVFRRGAGAFSVSHRPGMTRNQWALGRVNAFLNLLRTGRPERASYTTDNDLLPEEHAKSTKEES